VLDDFRTHSRSGIAHRNEHAVTARHLGRQIGAAGTDISRLDQKCTPLWHRIACIDRNVQKRGLDLIDIDHDRPEPACKGLLNVDRDTNRAAQHLFHLGDDRIQVRRRRLEMLLAREGEQRLGQFRPARGAT